MAGRSSLFVAAALAALMFRPGPGDARDGACIATLDPDTVLRGAPATEVTYGLSEEIGTIGQVTAPEQSGLRVSGVDPTTTMVTLDTQAAVVGDWDLTFHGSDEKTCVGTLHVEGIEK